MMPVDLTIRVAVCGGRTYSNRGELFQVLDMLGPKRILHGGANGADRLAGEYATERRIPVSVWKADWEHHAEECPDWCRYSVADYCKLAGFRRNQQIIDSGKPTLLVTFPGSGGTVDMRRKCEAAGVKVLAVPREGQVNGLTFDVAYMDEWRRTAGSHAANEE